MRSKRRQEKNQNEKIVLIALAITIAVFVFALYSYYQTYFGSEYKKAVSSQDPSDICKAPPGYTEESWREHMSHHPDQYRECLK